MTPSRKACSKRAKLCAITTANTEPPLIQRCAATFNRDWSQAVTLSGSRTVDTPGFGSTTTDFPVQINALAVAGYVFQSEAAAALYVAFLDRGDVTIDGTKAPATELRLTTAGASGLLPVGERWRLQGTLFGDLPVAPLGRNEQVGVGGTVALVYLWM